MYPRSFRSSTINKDKLKEEKLLYHFIYILHGMEGGKHV